MVSRSAASRGIPRVVAILLVLALAIAVAALTALALDRGRGERTPGVAAPVPTFTGDALPSADPEPTTTPTPAPTSTAPLSGAEITAPGADERFLAAGDGTMWRATAGSCGEVAPVVERSDDDGDTWSDVTPTYRDIAQVRDLLPFADTEADLVADMGDDCETQALRTFTQGTFWSPYDDLLPQSTYLTSGAAVIDGDEVAAPCETPWSLRTSSETAAAVCADGAYARADGEWQQLASGVTALDVQGDAVYATMIAADCDGLQVARIDGDVEPLECLSVDDPASPAAVWVTADAVQVWAGDELFSASR
ncbi:MULTISPECIES: hypothetical protein [unclassified Microbacterium]|uniref:hypothetical protein n=1 Tax=unclassified Microbacterium TaxID=2609290 RepID=UPI0038652F57